MRINTEFIDLLHMEMHVTEIVSDTDQSITQTFAVPEGTKKVAVLVEQKVGSAKGTITVHGVTTDNQSKISKAKLFFGDLKKDAKSIVVTVGEAAKSAWRITVTFFKKEAEHFNKTASCKVCKLVCRSLASSAFAALGVPYLPDVDFSNLWVAPPSDPFLVPPAVLPDHPFKMPEPNPVALQQFINEPNDSEFWLSDMFRRVHPGAKAAIFGVLIPFVREAAKKAGELLEPLDRIYEAACRKLGFCP